MIFAVYQNQNNPDTVEAFRLQMFKELEAEETPQNLALYERAWKNGHEGGFEEVYYHFVDLLDMQQDASGQL